MSYTFDAQDYVKICQAGYHYGDIAYVTDRFKLPDPHPCNMYVVVVINAAADQVTLPEEYLTEIETNLQELEDIYNKEHSSKPCECGADKVGFYHHYTWCPKYKR